MRNVNHNSRKVIFGISASLVLWALEAQAVAALPPDPNNAALLYYQALSLWSDVRSSYADTDAAQEPNDDSDTRPSTDNTKLDKFIAQERKMEREYELKFGKKKRESRRRLKRNRTIQLVEAASRIPRCTWGMYHSKGWELIALGPLRQLAFLLDDDARVLADAGDYRLALERCLTIRRFARHLGYEEISYYLASLGLDGLAFKRIHYVLELMPPDAGTLVWLQAQLAATLGASGFFVPALEIDFERSLQRLQKSPKTVARIRNRLMEAAGVVEEKESDDRFKNLTDKKLIPEIQEYLSAIFAEFFVSFRRAIESDKPCAQTYKEVELLTYKLRTHDEMVPFYDLTFVDHMPRLYSLHVNRRTLINAVEATIEIYLVKAKTGQLPETLPEGLPKDPYSGKDFEYEKTEQGFILRCRVKPVQNREVRQYEFKVQK